MEEIKRHDCASDKVRTEIFEAGQEQIQILRTGLPTEPIIRGNNLILRPMTLEDTPIFLRMRNDLAVSKWFIYRKEITATEHVRWMATHLVQGGDSRQFMIYAPSDNGFSYKIIGCTNLKEIDFVNKRAEYGLFLADPQVRGKGYGSETVSLMARYAFDCLGLNSIFSRVFTDNIPSVKHLEREGFVIQSKETAVACTDQTAADMYMMELFK